MRFTVPLLLSALFCAATLAAHADTINFTLTGGDGNLSFSLPSTASPVSFSSSYNTFNVANVIYNGTSFSNDTVYFYSPSDGGGLYVTNADNSFYVDEYGPTVFSGTSANPIFSNSSLTLSNGSAFANGTATSADGDVLTIAVVPAVSSVPEPSALALLGTGVIGLAGLGQRLRKA